MGRLCNIKMSISRTGTQENSDEGCVIGFWNALIELVQGAKFYPLWMEPVLMDPKGHSSTTHQKAVAPIL